MHNISHTGRAAAVLFCAALSAGSLRAETEEVLRTERARTLWMEISGGVGHSYGSVNGIVQDSSINRDYFTLNALSSNTNRQPLGLYELYEYGRKLDASNPAYFRLAGGWDIFSYISIGVSLNYRSIRIHDGFQNQFDAGSLFSFLNLSGNRNVFQTDPSYYEYAYALRGRSFHRHAFTLNADIILHTSPGSTFDPYIKFSTRAAGGSNEASIALHPGVYWNAGESFYLFGELFAGLYGWSSKYRETQNLPMAGLLFGAGMRR